MVLETAVDNPLAQQAESPEALHSLSLTVASLRCRRLSHRVLTLLLINHKQTLLSSASSHSK